MINAIVGRPRSGKSYEAVRYHLLPAILRDKRLVVTNVPIIKEYISKVHGSEYADLVIVKDGMFSKYGQIRHFSTVEDFLEFDSWKNEKGQGPLFIIDEMHLSAGRQANAQLLEYFSMHGHYGHDILCLTQNARKLNKDLKDMIEICWRTVKMSAYGDDKSYLQKTYHGVENTRDEVNVEERQYDPEYYPYYKSHTQSKGSVLEAVASDVKAVLNPYAKWSRRLLILGALWMAYVVYGIFSDDEPIQAKEQVEQVEQVAQQPQGLQSGDNLQQPKLQNQISQSDISQANKRELNELDKGDDYHPFHKVKLHISGSYADQVTGHSNIYFGASANGQKLFDIQLKDLFLAGYDVRVYTDCLVRVKFFSYSEFITCDVPTVGIDPGQTVTSLAN